MILTKHTLMSIGAVVLAAGSLVACGNDEGSTSGSSSAAGSADTSGIVATTSIWADITSRITCGEPITALIPPGADPHTFEPSLRDRERLDDASVVIANGGHLEGSLVDLLDTAASDGAVVIEMTSHVDVLPIDPEAVEHEDADDDHEAGDGDPHIWQDPTRVAGALDVIADAVIDAGLDPAEVDACTAEYRDELTTLDGDIANTLSSIPDANRVMVTSHDSLAYFADRYDLEVVGTVIPSTNTLAETNAADLAELADVIEQRHVPAIFTEQLESTADADALADRLGVRIVPLVTDSLTDTPPGDTYVGMLRSNATKIAEALTP